jgi:hypothetical protein
MRLMIGVMVAFSLTSCASLNPLGFLSSGVNTAANVQAGKTNTQTLGTTRNNTVTESVVDKVDQSNNQLKTEKVETVNIQQTPLWMIILLILGWLLPSPGEMARWFKGLFKRKKDGPESA